METLKKIIGFLIGFALVIGIFYYLRSFDSLKRLKPYHSKEGDFSVLFPGEPERKMQKLDTGIGKLEFVLYSAETRKAAFAVGYVDYPEDMITDNMLDDARDDIVKKVKGTLESEKVLDYHGHVGREFEIKVQEQATVKARVFLIDDRLYQIMVISGSERIIKTRGSKFLDSFEVDSVGLAGEIKQMMDDK